MHNTTRRWGFKAEEGNTGVASSSSTPAPAAASRSRVASVEMLTQLDGPAICAVGRRHLDDNGELPEQMEQGRSTKTGKGGKERIVPSSSASCSPAAPPSPFLCLDSPPTSPALRTRSFALSPAAWPLESRRSPSSPPAGTSKRHANRKQKQTSVSSSPSSSSSSAPALSTVPTASPQWLWLMAQATQTDPRYSYLPPSPLDGSFVVAYDDREALDCITQTEEGEEEEEDNSSLETSLLLLDTLTQDDSVAGYGLDVGGSYDDAVDISNGERSGWQANVSRKAAVDSRGKCSHSPCKGPLDSPLLGTPTQEDRPSLLLAPTQMDLLNASTQVDPAPGFLPFTEGDSLDSLPTQHDGQALAAWRCGGVTQTDDHPTEIDTAHPILTPLGSKDASR